MAASGALEAGFRRVDLDVPERVRRLDVVGLLADEVALLADEVFLADELRLRVDFR